MPISVPTRGSLGNRQARPFTGLEVKQAVESHLIALTDRILNSASLLSDEIISLTESLKQSINDELNKQALLNKINITYPRAGWNIKSRLLEREDGSHFVTAEVELDLQRGTRIHIIFGPRDPGNVIRSEEEEKIPSGIPDRDRERFGMPVLAEYIRPDGTTGLVDIKELKRAARTVDVGPARTFDVTHGEPIVTPAELPPVTFDDVVAQPPVVETAPPEKPLPSPGTMAKQVRPNVKLK